MRHKVIIDFTRWRDADLNRDAQHIVICMKDNEQFPMLADPSAELTNAASAFHQALMAAIGGGNISHAEKAEKRQALIEALRNLGTRINLEACGDRPRLETTGFPLVKLAKRRTRQQEDIRLVVARHAVAIHLKTKPGVPCHLLQYTEAPVTAESVWTTLWMMSSNVVINGLVTERKYAFRLAPCIHLEAPDFSEPVVSKFVE